MNKIIIATNNPDKYREIKNIWKDLEEYELDWLGNYPDIKDIQETGDTLEENASIKAKFTADMLGFYAVADDTGLFVDYLDGAPGIYSSRFAGENATYEENVEKLLDVMEGIPRKERRAEFRCIVCLSRKNEEDIFTMGVVKGYITQKRRGEHGFGYDPVFEVDETGRTFAQMQPEEKNSISHRFLAFKNMKNKVREVAQFG
ncbi:MAG: RdgB/HAM1 family non-canonical purine NTP pyrophosphatase [Elusimicrobiota bacterium]